MRPQNSQSEKPQNSQSERPQNSQVTSPQSSQVTSPQSSQSERPPSSQGIRPQNRALALLVMCYPATPPALVCGIQVCLGKSEFLPGLVVFYTLIVVALAQCIRHIPTARLAFGAALLTTLVHMGLAVMLIRGIGQDSHFEALLGSMFLVGFWVGLGGAKLAWSQGRKALALGLVLTGVCLALGVWSQALKLHVFFDFGTRHHPGYFMAAFYVQAFLLWLSRQHESPRTETGTGLNQAEASGVTSREF